MLFLIVLLQALFGISFIIFKKSLLYTAPIFSVAVRMLFSGVFMLLIYTFFQERVKLTKSIVFFTLMATVFNIYLTNVPEILGLEVISASKANFIYNFSPFFTAFFGYLFLGERLNFNKIISLILGCMGFFVIIFFDNTTTDVKLFYNIELGELLILLASVATIWGWISIKRLVGHEGVSIAFANGTSMFFGGILSLIHSFCVEPWNPMPCNNIGWGLFWTILGAIVSCLMAYNLNAYFLKRYTATFMSLTTLISPLFTVVLGILFLNEKITMGFMVAFILVFIATYIFFKEEKVIS